MKTTSAYTMLRRLPATVGYMLQIAFRHALGRWFIFRDAPDWFVQTVALTTDDEIDHADARALVCSARDEWKLRKRQRNLRRPVNTARHAEEAKS